MITSCKNGLVMILTIYQNCKHINALTVSSALSFTLIVKLMKTTEYSLHVFGARLIIRKLKLLIIIEIILTEPTVYVNDAT